MSTNIKTKRLGYFRGVDYSSDPSEVADYRLAKCENMYKDYHSGQGQAIETIPGFRLINDFGAKIYGIHVYQKGDEKTLIVHAGKNLYKTNVWKDPVEITKIPIYKPFLEGEEGFDSFYDIMAEHKSESFNFNNRIYIIDGKNYIYYSDEDTEKAHRVIDNAYIPTTHISLRPDGSEIEETKSSGEKNQRNILTGKFKTTYVGDGKGRIFSLPIGVDGNNSYTSSLEFEFMDALGVTTAGYIASFENQKEISVVQYDVKLPWADVNGQCPYDVVYDSEGNIKSVEQYPNAIVSVSSDGVVTLVNAPPLPENNKYGINKKGELVTDSDRYRKPAGSAGIEITGKKTVTEIKGIENTNGYLGIIPGCTISTVHDGRVFLSGNPDYPNFVFFCGRNPETGYIDPSYFGILDWFSEGVTNTPITALMPIADTLMVLRKDTVQDGSVTYRSRYETGEDVIPVVYQGSGGLPGVGCLGASCNFLDDPIFVSKYGIEAMGQLSARYERAIEHRSNLIDGLLLNKKLENASIAEFDGYMWVLIEGEIFLADSRQRYTHSSGVMNYEWFYLKEIGVYKGQKGKKVYGEVLPEFLGKKIKDSNNIEYTIISLEKLKEIKPEEAHEIGDEVTGEFTEIQQNLDNYKVASFRAYTEKDDFNNTIYYAVYLEKPGYMVGGAFDPAMLIKTVDHNKLVFGTERGSLCMFNFDKRDTEDNYKIPNQYYTFNGRIIKSVLATKMDNCGVLNYVKNTVKKSMVVKMRTFEKSGAKVFVLTNRQTGHEVERLIGGRWDDITTDFNFEKLTCETDEKNIFRVREKEKKWLEKQLFLVSDEFKEPFALHYIAYDFIITGRYKD